MDVGEPQPGPWTSCIFPINDFLNRIASVLVLLCLLKEDLPPDGHSALYRRMSVLTGLTITRFTTTLSHFVKSIPSHQRFASVAMPYVHDQPQISHRRSITAVMMRSGTSKGLFLHRDHLPDSMEEWSPILLSAMGSATGGKRQLSGVGGATSTTSKVAVIGKSERDDADIDYTFAQVAVGNQTVDMSGNCGNMASGVGPFALDEGLVTASPGQKEVWSA